MQYFRNPRHMSVDYPESKIAHGSTKKPLSFRVYAGLNDFLLFGLKQKTFTLYFKTPIKAGEVIESIGIPLSEVKLVLVNSEPADFSARLKEHDFISLYPAFENIDISPVTNVNGNAEEFLRFILDSHLGKLAKYLRMLGFDTLYQSDYDDCQIIEIARIEERIILTRDKLLLKSKDVRSGYYVRAVEKRQQLREVVLKFSLSSKIRSFTRCMTCNAELIFKTKNEVAHKIDPDTLRIFDEFYFCPDCDKVFWKGSHFMHMEKFIVNQINSC